MVNGRTLKDELKRIKKYFDSLSLEEYEEQAIKNGMNRKYDNCASLPDKVCEMWEPSENGREEDKCQQ